MAEARDEIDHIVVALKKLEDKINKPGVLCQLGQKDKMRVEKLLSFWEKLRVEDERSREIGSVLGGLYLKIRSLSRQKTFIERLIFQALSPYKYSFGFTETIPRSPFRR
ncbi:hypothetical protein GF382_02475 [Candidatus Falkowbacteria bacterium]|nr:hypothetical protein [Candidatus Falkowbacteria bacterium]